MDHVAVWSAPLASRALEIGRARSGAAHAPGQEVKPAGHVPGRTLATLKAFNSFAESEPEEPQP